MVAVTAFLECEIFFAAILGTFDLFFLGIERVGQGIDVLQAGSHDVFRVVRLKDFFAHVMDHLQALFHGEAGHRWHVAESGGQGFKHA